MGNFDFLSERWEKLAKLGELAEQYLYSDTNSCFMQTYGDFTYEPGEFVLPENKGIDLAELEEKGRKQEEYIDALKKELSVLQKTGKESAERKSRSGDVIWQLQSGKRIRRWENSDLWIMRFLYATNGQPYLKQIATKSGIWELDVRGGRAPKALSGWKSPEGRTEVLLSMATGTRKTRTILGMLYRFLKAKRFRRVLFLVDRTALGEQYKEEISANAP